MYNTVVRKLQRCLSRSIYLPHKRQRQAQIYGILDIRTTKYFLHHNCSLRRQTQTSKNKNTAVNYLFKYQIQCHLLRVITGTWWDHHLHHLLLEILLEATTTTTTVISLPVLYLQTMILRRRQTTYRCIYNLLLILK